MALTLEKEKLTFQIEEIGGLWSTERQAKKCLEKCHTEKERRAALKIQLSFRLKVLGSSCDKRYFFLSAKGKIRTSAELLANLMTVIKETSIDHLSEPQHQIYHEPIIIDQEKLMAGKKSLVSQGKRNSTDKITVMAKKKKNEEVTNTPVVSCQDDLSGKLVEHFCSIDEDNLEEDWHRGVVLERHGKNNFLIRYNEKPDILFSRNIYSYFLQDKLKISSVSFKDFISATITHQYTDDKTNEDIWWDAEVVDVDLESPDMNNPSFYILYKDSSEEIIDFSQINDSDYFLEPLINDYLNG